MDERLKTSWRGIYPAMLTPLKRDESLDEDACADLIVRLSGSCRGLYLTGGTGEEYGISDKVREQVYRIAVPQAKGALNLIAHVGGVHTGRAAALAESACSAGVDAVSALPPHGGIYSFAEIHSFYREIADASSTPLIIYHIPAVTGYRFSLEELSDLLNLPGVEGIKFTDTDCFLLERLRDRFPDRLFFMGNDQMLVQGLCAGADGAIGSTYNLISSAAQRVIECFDRGDISGACASQKNINIFVEKLLSCPNTVRAVKALAGEVYGWEPVSPAPGMMPDEADIKELRSAMKNILTG